MYRPISRDLKICAINLYEKELLPLEDILDCVGFSESTFYRVLALWRTTGDVVRHTYGLRGRPRLLVFDDVEYILRLVRHRPDWFLDEIADLLQENRFISAHFSTICRELQRYGYTSKKLKRIARERSEFKRACFVEEIADYDQEQLGFIDETSKDHRTAGRRKGRAKKGRRAQRRQRFVRGARLTATGFLTTDGMVTSTVIEGSMTRETFCEFLEESVVCFPPSYTLH
jgi:transposase